MSVVVEAPGHSAVSPCVAQIEVQKRKGEPIPKGWAVDNEGQITDDPLRVLDDDGGLLYVGGAEETGGYKGYGLSMMVEVLGGILGGGPYGKNIRQWKQDSRVANLVSQCRVETLMGGREGLSLLIIDEGGKSGNFGSL